MIEKHITALACPHGMPVWRISQDGETSYELYCTRCYDEPCQVRPVAGGEERYTHIDGVDVRTRWEGL